MVWALGTVGTPPAQVQSHSSEEEKIIRDSESERSGLNWKERGLLVSGNNPYGLRTCEFNCLGGLLALGFYVTQIFAASLCSSILPSRSTATLNCA